MASPNNFVTTEKADTRKIPKIVRANSVLVCSSDSGGLPLRSHL